jgi:hypothetical protein
VEQLGFGLNPGLQFGDMRAVDDGNAVCADRGA